MDWDVMGPLTFILAVVAVVVWVLLGAVSYRIWPESDPYDKEELRTLAVLAGPAYIPMKGTLHLALRIMGH